MDCEPAADAAADLAAIAAGWDRHRSAYLRARALADGPTVNAQRLVEGLAASTRRTLSPETCGALPPWVERTRADLGIVALNVAALLALGDQQWATAESLAAEVVARDHHDLLAQRMVDAAHERSPGLVSAVDRWLANRVCPAPFEQIETRADGRVHFCCSGWQPVPIGNLSDGAPEIWNSARAREIRRSVLDGDFTHCSRWHCPAIAARRLPLRAEIAAGGSTLARAVRERATRIDPTPTRVILSHDRSCNISCPSCRDHVIQAGHARSAALDTLFEKSLRPLLTHARAIKLTGSGDPFASRHFRSLLRTVATDAGKRQLQLHTNGLLFDERAWEELALDGRVDSVWISVDAAQRRTYSVLRRGGNFGQLLRNLYFLGALRRHGAFNRLRLDFVVQAANYREMGDFVDLARRVAADGVYFIRLRNWGHIPVAQFHEMDVCDALHPEHPRLLAQLADPRLCGPTADLGSLASLLPADDSRFDRTPPETFA